MGIRAYKPTSAARRYYTVNDFAELTTDEPLKKLVEAAPLSVHGGLAYIRQEALSHAGGPPLAPPAAFDSFSKTIPSWIDGMVDNPPTVIAHIEANRLRPLAVAASARMALLPNVPTAAEAGVANYEASSWFGIAAPAATPPAVVARLHQAIAAAVRTPAMQERFAKSGARLVGNTPEAFASQIRAERVKWGEIIRAAGITAE